MSKLTPRKERKLLGYLSQFGTLEPILPTGIKFHMDDTRRRLIVGPVGTGKSSIMTQEIFMRAARQRPGPDGVRRTRWVVIRNTYGQLQDTTIKTWLQWFPESRYGKFQMLPRPQHTMEFQVENNETGEVTTCHVEVLFRALDRADQVDNLLSLEVTGAWINEVRDIPKAVFDMLDGRIGRYPSRREGGCTWMGIFMDTNPPDEDHWLVDTFEEQQLPGHHVYHQSYTENIANLPEGYYDNLRVGKSPEWIKIYLEGQYGFIAEGAAVYPDFDFGLHVADEPIEVMEGVVVRAGFDFGLTPACAWLQVTPMGQIQVIHEEVSTSMGIDRFGDWCVEVQNRLFPHVEEFIYAADPAGWQRAQTDEKTCVQLLAEKGINCEPGPITTTARKTPVEYALTTIRGGQPILLISPTCKMIKKGFMGGYCYKEIGNTGTHSDKPEKNQYSHVMEALEYVIANTLTIVTKRNKPAKTRRKSVSWQTV